MAESTGINMKRALMSLEAIQSPCYSWMVLMCFMKCLGFLIWLVE